MLTVLLYESSQRTGNLIASSLNRYWTVMFSDAPAQVPPLTYEPVTLAGPAPTKVATLPEKVATALLLELQVVKLVTSAPL